MREAAALKALRTGDASSFLQTPMPNMPGDKTMESNTVVRKEVQDMLSRGWIRGKSEVDDFKSDLWGRNDMLAKRLLRDL